MDPLQLIQLSYADSESSESPTPPIDHNDDAGDNVLGTYTLVSASEERLRIRRSSRTLRPRQQHYESTDDDDDDDEVTGDVTQRPPPTPPPPPRKLAVLKKRPRRAKDIRVKFVLDADDSRDNLCCRKCGTKLAKWSSRIRHEQQVCGIIPDPDSRPPPRRARRPRSTPTATDTETATAAPALSSSSPNKRRRLRSSGTERKERTPGKKRVFAANYDEVKRNRTDYSSSRLRKKASLSYASHLPNNPLMLVDCEEYRTNRQPFSVEVSFPAVIMQDIHAHLAHAEIIGLLGGYWDATHKVLRVMDAFPCEADVVENQTNNVEMNAESQVRVQTTINERGMATVGWYHSHPHFCNTPSLRDVENQTNYQVMCEDQPFVAAITSPYNDGPRVSDVSETRWFNTRFSGVRQCDMPMNLSVTYTHDNTGELSMDTVYRVRELISSYRDFDDRVDLREMWRGTRSRLDKMRISAYAHFPDTIEPKKRAQYLDQMLELVPSWWSNGEFVAKPLVAIRSIVSIDDTSSTMSDFDTSYEAMKRSLYFDSGNGGDSHRIKLEAPQAWLSLECSDDEDDSVIPIQATEATNVECTLTTAAWLHDDDTPQMYADHPTNMHARRDAACAHIVDSDEARIRVCKKQRVLMMDIHGTRSTWKVDPPASMPVPNTNERTSRLRSSSAKVAAAAAATAMKSRRHRGGRSKKKRINHRPNESPWYGSKSRSCHICSVVFTSAYTARRHEVVCNMKRLKRAEEARAAGEARVAEATQAVAAESRANMKLLKDIEDKKRVVEAAARCMLQEEQRQQQVRATAAAAVAAAYVEKHAYIHGYTKTVAVTTAAAPLVVPLLMQGAQQELQAEESASDDVFKSEKRMVAALDAHLQCLKSPQAKALKDHMHSIDDQRHRDDDAATAAADNSLSKQPPPPTPSTPPAPPQTQHQRKQAQLLKAFEKSDAKIVRAEQSEASTRAARLEKAKPPPPPPPQHHHQQQQTVPRFGPAPSTPPVPVTLAPAPSAMTPAPASTAIPAPSTTKAPAAPAAASASLLLLPVVPRFGPAPSTPLVPVTSVPAPAPALAPSSTPVIAKPTPAPKEPAAAAAPATAMKVLPTNHMEPISSTPLVPLPLTTSPPASAATPAPTTTAVPAVVSSAPAAVSSTPMSPQATAVSSALPASVPPPPPQPPLPPTATETNTLDPVIVLPMVAAHDSTTSVSGIDGKRIHEQASSVPTISRSNKQPPTAVTLNGVQSAAAVTQARLNGNDTQTSALPRLVPAACLRCSRTFSNMYDYDIHRVSCARRAVALAVPPFLPLELSSAMMTFERMQKRRIDDQTHEN